MFIWRAIRNSAIHAKNTFECDGRDDVAMNVGKREQILLFILALVLVWVLPVRFIFIPAAQNYTSNVQTLSELQTKQLEMQTLVQANAGMGEKVEQAQEDAAARSARFFPTFESEQMGLWMLGFTEEAGLRNSQVAISDRGSVYIASYSDVVPVVRIALDDLVSQMKGESIPAAADDTQETASELPAIDMVFVNTVTVTADCYYDNLMYYIDLLQQSGRTLQISGVEFKLREDDSGIRDVVTATVTVQVYSIPKFYTDDMMDLEFDLPEGKTKII